MFRCRVVRRDPRWQPRYRPRLPRFRYPTGPPRWRSIAKGRWCYVARVPAGTNASQSACVNGAVRVDAQTRETRKPTRAESRHGSRGLIDDHKVAIGRHWGGGVAAIYSIHDDAGVQRDGSEDQTEDKRGRIHSAYADRSEEHTSELQ